MTRRMTAPPQPCACGAIAFICKLSRTLGGGRQLGQAGIMDGAGPVDPLDLGGYAPYWLAMLSAHLSRRLHEVIRDEHGLALTEWRVMAVLGWRESASGREVSALAGLDEVAVHRAVTTLLGRALIQRELDPGDRRRKILRISETGWRVYAAILPHARAVEGALLEAMPEADRSAALDALRQAYRVLVAPHP